MSRRTTFWAALSMMALSFSAHAGESPPAPAPAPAPAPTASSRPPAAAPAAGSPRAASGPRTLQEIHIEGDIPAPQVLFITARDQRRFMDLNHRRYLRTSREVGERTVLPTWIDVTGTRTTHP